MSKYITIGMDLGNKKHAVCALDQAGNVMWRKDVANTPEALTAFFGENADATASLINAVQPHLLFIGTLHAEPGCRLYKDMQSGAFRTMPDSITVYGSQERLDAAVQEAKAA